MRMRQTLTLAVVLSVAVSAVARDSKLAEYRSDDGRYLVKLPGRPKRDTKNLAVGASGLAIPVTTDRADGPNSTVFAVTFADYPESFKDVPVKTILDGVRDGLKGMDGKVTKDDEVTVGSDPNKVVGRDYRIDAGAKSLRVRVFLVDGRLYQVMVTGTKDTIGQKQVTEFLESFRLLR